MFKWLKKSKTLKDDLLNFKDEPLSGLSIVLLIILDIFIFTNVMIGVESETNRAPKVYKYYPSECTMHFEKVRRAYKDFHQYHSSYVKALHLRPQVSPLCLELGDKIQALRVEKEFKQNYKAIEKIEQTLRLNDRRLKQIAKEYNTRLFERIAQMQNNEQLKRAKDEYDTLTQDNIALTQARSQIAPVHTLKGYSAYAAYVKQNREAFESEKASYTFWQPFKAYAYMLVFILPLLLFFAFFYFKTKRQQLKGKPYNPVVKIISAHIALILILPLFAYTLGLIYHVLPKTLLKNIIEFLLDLGLVSLLNYAAIALVVLIFGGLIYWIQKRALRQKSQLSNKKLQIRRVALSHCFKCGLKVDYTKPYCPFCAQGLHKTCSHCGAVMNKPEHYCSSCSKPDSSMTTGDFE